MLRYTEPVFLALRNLIRRPRRSVLTLAGISVGTAAYISLVAVGSGLLRQFQDTVSLLGSDIVVQQRSAASVWVSRLSSKQVDALKTVPGVARVTPVVVSSTRFLGQKFFVVLGLDPDASLFERCRLVDGQWYESGVNEMMIGHQAAQAIDLAAGDRIEARNEEFLIAGVYDTGRSLLDGAAVMDLAAARRMFDHGDNTTLAFVDVKRPDRIEEVIEEIRQQLPDLAANRSDMWISTYEQYMIVRRFTRSLAALALLVTILWISNTLHITFSERRRELAVLRAIGWRPRQIAATAFYEMFLLSSLGGVVGIILARCMVGGLANLDQNGIYGTQLTSQLAVEGISVALAAGLIGGLLPVLRVLHVRAAESLRAV